MTLYFNDTDVITPLTLNDDTNNMIGNQTYPTDDVFCIGNPIMKDEDELLATIGYVKKACEELRTENKLLREENDKLREHLAAIEDKIEALWFCPGPGGPGHTEVKELVNKTMEENGFTFM